MHESEPLARTTVQVSHHFSGEQTGDGRIRKAMLTFPWELLQQVFSLTANNHR